MTQVFMEITGAQGRARKTGLLTAGMVGVPVQFSFSPEWAELNCLAVFRAGEVKKDNAITDGCSVIPAEVLQQPGQRLYIGVEGRSKQGDVVIPTVWAEVGQILEGAQAANDPALAPTPSQFERFMAQVEQVDEKIKAALQDVNISGAGAFTIVVTDMTADKTNGEIYEAYQAAKPAYLQAVIEEVPYIFRPVSVLPEMALFTMNSGTAGVVLRIIRDEVSIEYQELAKREEIPLVPENVSAFDNDAGYQTAAEVERIVEQTIGDIDIPAGGGGSATWKKIIDETLTQDVASWAVTLDKAYKKFKILICAFPSANVSAGSAWLEINIGEGRRYLGKPRYQNYFAAETDAELVDGYLITTCKTSAIYNGSGAVADVGWKLATTTNLTETKNVTLFGEAYLKTGARIIIFAEESA